MPNLTLAEDPLLFLIETSHGQMAVQLTEMMYEMHKQGVENPTPEQAVAAIRKCSRTPEVANKCSDAELFAFFQRMTTAALSAGNA
jgi:hypothetical protein